MWPFEMPDERENLKRRSGKIEKGEKESKKNEKVKNCQTEPV